MITDITTIKDSSIEADVCVIGAGAAGISLCRELMGSPLRVVLLEGGALERHPAHQALYELETSDLPIDPNSRMRAFGGTTTVWGGGWKLLDETDFEKRDWVPFSGWPITCRELNPYYDRAAALANGPSVKGFDSDAIGRRITEKKGYFFATNLFQTTLMRLLADKDFDFGKKFRAMFEQSPLFCVLLNAHVTKLVADGAGKGIREALVQTLDGKKYVVRAKQFVVACGGIENARLLLVSDVGNNNDQVGRYYMDHPKCPGGVLVPSDTHRDLSLYWKPQDIDGLVIGGVHLSPEQQRAQRVLNAYMQFRPWYVPDSALLRAVKAFTNEGLLFRIFRKVFRARSTLTELHVRNYMEQAPSPDNRVTLSRKKDALGNPLAHVAWSLNVADVEGLRALHRTVQREVERLGIGTFSSPLLDHPDMVPKVRDASHHMGTTRMGGDPTTSVVDADCKVHGVNNLFIAGSSLFPTSGHANPTATIIALAIRLADYLKKNLS